MLVSHTVVLLWAGGSFTKHGDPELSLNHFFIISRERALTLILWNTEYVVRTCACTHVQVRWNSFTNKWVTASEDGTIRIWVCIIAHACFVGLNVKYTVDLII